MKGYLYVMLWAVAAGCSAKGSSEEKVKPVALPVMEVVVKDTTLHLDYVSSIEAVKNVEIRTRVQGFIKKIFVDEGAEVKKGQPLFQLDDKELAIVVAKAKASYKNAVAEAKTIEVELERVKTLLDKKVISATELDMTQAKLKAAQAKIEVAASEQHDAEAKLSYTFIRSPFDGIIDRIPLKAGSLVSEGTLLTTISDNKDVYAYFTVSENDYLNYKKQSPDSINNHVSLLLSDGSEYEHTGKIETVDGEFDEMTGSIAFRARFPNPARLLRHGATGKVRLTEPAKEALIIPQKSVFEVQDKNYVFVLDEENNTRMQNIIPQTRLADYYIIKGGLKTGDKIVYEGIQNVKEGIRVQPLMVNDNL
ncbi:efflux RND transporter periplasmic adaptor subunit [Terrimonas rubra]|uniref:Efflux RND transporter periplasmic adaptor subunit n=1 Tax=Terrimonas rubra TaxID=1035890 RepID=A0ABW6A0Y4_9BACT